MFWRRSARARRPLWRLAITSWDAAAEGNPRCLLRADRGIHRIDCSNPNRIRRRRRIDAADAACLLLTLSLALRAAYSGSPFGGYSSRVDHQCRTRQGTQPTDRLAPCRSTNRSASRCIHRLMTQSKVHVCIHVCIHVCVHAWHFSLPGGRRSASFREAVTSSVDTYVDISEDTHPVWFTSGLHDPQPHLSDDHANRLAPRRRPARRDRTRCSRPTPGLDDRASKRPL